MNRQVIIKTPEQIANITEAGKWHTELLHILTKASQAGTTLIEIEAQAQRFLDMHNLTWAFKWFNWFPANCCLSLNDCVVHWIPDETVLKEWDFLKIDVGVVYKWWISDAAVTLVVWWAKHNPEWQKLIDSTKVALDNWLKRIAPGKSFYEYGIEVERTMKNNWFSVIKNLTGHGVGVEVHEAPSIYNRGFKKMKKSIARPWMVIALEPITAVNSKEFIHWTENSWNIYTEHWDLWAQWEYTVVITENWYKVIAWIQ